MCFFSCNKETGKVAEDVSSNKDATSEDKIIVICTIIPQLEFIERIGGNRINAIALIPPGASPHSYEPLPGQLKAVSEARIYLKVGSGIEFELSWMDKIIGLNRDMTVIDCSEGIRLIDAADGDENHDGQQHDEKGGTDPHIWLSLKNAKIIADNIYRGLIKVDPLSMEYYRQNLVSYQKEIDNLDRNIASLFSKKSSRKIIVLHPSWGYFARDYELEQIAIENMGKEPTLKNMEEIIELAIENDIKIIFASPESNTKIAESIADEINGSVILISPLEKDYLQNMEKIASIISETLN